MQHGEHDRSLRTAPIGCAWAHRFFDRCDSDGKHRTNGESAPNKTKATKAPAGKNPLLEQWTTPFEMPPFDKVKTEHFLPAIDKGFADNLEEIAAIANNREAPTFANTIDALEGAGRLLDRVSAVFFNLSGTDTTPEIQAIERSGQPMPAIVGMRVVGHDVVPLQAALFHLRPHGISIAHHWHGVVTADPRVQILYVAALRPHHEQRQHRGVGHVRPPSQSLSCVML